MPSDWIKVYSSDKLHNVELLKHILHENQIDAVVLNQQDSFYVTIGEINLLVKRENIMLAKELISKAKL